MNDLMRPALYQAWMGIVPVQNAKSRQAPGMWSAPCANPATGSGKNDRWAVHAGDRIAVLSAGAYGMSMASN